MKTYVENLLTRLEQAVDHTHVVTPRVINRNDFLAVILLVVQYQGQETVIRADKLIPFLHGIDMREREAVHIGIGLSLVRVTGKEDGVFIGEGVFDEALWREDFGDKPLPPAPVFKMIKQHDTLKYDYEQAQNFIWRATGDYANELKMVGNEETDYLDLEYYLHTLLRDPQMFDNASRLIVNFLTHHIGGDEEWGKMLHARLVKMRYKTIFINQVESSKTVH